MNKTEHETWTMVVCLALTLVCGSTATQTWAIEEATPLIATMEAVPVADDDACDLEACEETTPTESEPKHDDKSISVTIQAVPAVRVVEATPATKATPTTQATLVVPAARLTTAAGLQSKAEAASPQKAATQTLRVSIESARAQLEARRKAEEEARAADPAWQPSHAQVGEITVGDKPNTLNNFCVHPSGNILACCGGQRVVFSMDRNGGVSARTLGDPGQIRVVSPAGNLLSTWSVDFKPEAICVTPNGEIFVGGGGRLAKLSSDGEILATGESPAMTTQAEEDEDLDGPKIAPNTVTATLQVSTKTSATVVVQASAEVQADSPEVDEEAAKKEAEAKKRKAQMEEYRGKMMAERKKSVTGIAVTDKDIFVACPAPEGFGFAVYRLDHDFCNATLIINGLRGCCGQMDIQAKDGKLWVSENAKHHVVCYDRDGNQLSEFGKKDRKAADGFGGCCEPKNARLLSNGEILTASSGPPVCVKRFSAAGEFLGVVALPVYRTGCVRATVDVSPEGDKLYLMNIGESKIVVFADEQEQLATPTHEEIMQITMPESEKPSPLHAFCVAKDNNVLAACGGERYESVRSPGGMTSEPKLVEEPAVVQVFSPAGEVLDNWKLTTTPEAINVNEEGTVFIGGQGRLAKLSAQGETLLTVDAPHIAELPELPPIPDEDEEKLSEEEQKAREEKIAKLQTEMREYIEQLQTAMKEMTEVRNSGDKEALEKANVAYREILTKYSAVSQELRPLTISPRVLALQQRRAALAKRAISAIAATGEDVFIACRATKGSGFDVWRTDRNFSNAKKIVTGLVGCCGHMNIQAHDSELFVAENARGRVVRYNRDGELISMFGEMDRKGGIVGFGSCCNPMNIAFGPDGSIYASESNLGRVKRFTKDGEFLGIVGVVEPVVGCKDVAVAVNADGSHVYRINTTKGHIVVMASKDTAAMKTAANTVNSGETR